MISRLGAALSTLAIVSTLSAIASADALVAKAKVENRAYTLHDVTLDGTASSSGADVTYFWTVLGADKSAKIDDADKPTAHITFETYGHYNFVLKVTRGAETEQAKANIEVIQDPSQDYPDFPGAEKIVYKTAPDILKGMHKLPMYVFKPADWKPTDHRSAILLFHGGGWSAGDASRYLPDAAYYASRGMFAATVEYRTGGREGTAPGDCVADAKSAMRYVRSHAAELGIDPNKIADGGESAGAHIAAAAGTVPAYNDPSDDQSVSCVPSAMLLYFPFKMIGAVGNRKDDMSPMDFIGPQTPPTLFIAGEQDRIAPAENGITWQNKMEAVQRPCSLFIYKRVHHPSGVPDYRKPGVENDLVRQGDIFLAAAGLLEGPPTVPPEDKTWTAERLYVNPKTFVPPPPPLAKTR